MPSLDPIARLFPDVGLDHRQLFRVKEFFDAISVVEKLGKKPKIVWEKGHSTSKCLALYVEEPI